MSEFVLMNGPSIRDPRVQVNRKVHKRDVEIYKGVGYKEGFIEGLPKPEDVADPNAEPKAEKPSKTKDK